MFFAGLVVIIISAIFIIIGNAAHKRGDFRASSITLFGKIGIVLGIILFAGSCLRIIGPGEVGVLDLFGKVSDREINSGVNLVNPLMRVHTFSIKTKEMQETMNVPSQEGLQVDLDVSILYRIKPDNASEIFRTIGPQFDRIVILPSFRSAARTVSVRYDAKALYTAGREIITQALYEDLQQSLTERGIIIEKVLLRSIRLPDMVTNAIEEKLKAEQEAQKMVFVLQKEEREAERKKIEAVGISDANKIIAQGLTSSYIQWYRIEMLKQLINSPNNTIIIIPDDLKSVPMILNK
ncbi:prohibitin family protein [bacterium]|nr:prohibitin family protein [bacterium]